MTAPARTRVSRATVRMMLAAGAVSVALAAGCGPAAKPAEEPEIAPPTVVATTAGDEQAAGANGTEPGGDRLADAAGTALEPGRPEDPAGASPGGEVAFGAGSTVPEQAVATGPYAKGRALSYMPRDCDERVYVDVAGLAGPDRAELSKLVDQAVSWAGPIFGGSGSISSALSTLRAAGVEPARAVHEIAACDSPDIAVIGFEATKPIDSLVTLQKLLVTMGEQPGVIERRAGYRALSERPGGREAAVDVAPGVLLLVDDWRAGEQALVARAGQTGFRDAARSLVWVKTDDGSLVVDEKGAQLDVVLRARAAEDPTTAPKIAQREVAKIKQELGRVATRLGSSPLKALAPRLRAVRISAEGADIVARGAISRSDIAELLRALGSMGIQDLEALVEGREPPPPPPPPRR